MHNILKGFLEPEAETYVLPNADDIHFEGEEEFIPPPEEEEEAADRSLDVTVGDEAPEEAHEPGEPEPPPEPKKEKEKETPIHYAQLQAELILNQSREEAEQIVAQAREQAQAEV